MRMNEAKKQLIELKEYYPALAPRLFWGQGEVHIRVYGVLKDGQNNELDVSRELETLDDCIQLMKDLKEFYSQYNPRDINSNTFKTFSFNIELNEMISWKQFSEFLAWYHVPYYTNPRTRLVTIEKDLENNANTNRP